MVRSQARIKKTVPVSVILPVYNGAQYLSESLKSILNQTCRQFELLVVNDGSTDGTHEILKNVRDRRISVINFKRKHGIAFALNAGLLRARGTYIARMDADDVSESTRLATQIAYLNAHLDVALVGTWSTLINTRGKQVGVKKFPTKDRDIRSVITRYNPFVHPSVMVRRSVFHEIGSYRSKYEGAEDYDLFLRICARYRVANIPKLLFKFRQHPRSVSFAEMKRIEYQALRVRIHALKKLGYPGWNYINLIKPALAFLIPAFWKQKLLWP